MRKYSVFLLGLVVLASSAWATAIGPLDLCHIALGDKSYRVEKVNTFPDLAVTNAIQYARTVELPRALDQCANACSFNSVASYFEALDSYVRTGTANSPNAIQISANALNAATKSAAYLNEVNQIGTSDQFLSAGRRHGATELLGILDSGVILEKDFPSINSVDTKDLVQDLNLRLYHLRQHYLNRSMSLEAKAAEAKYVAAAMQSAFGASLANDKIYSLAHLKIGNGIAEYSNRIGGIFIQRKWDGGVDVKRVKSEVLLDWTFSAIRETIDRGLPLKMGYYHVDDFLDAATGIYELKDNRDVTVNNGHAVLITGYRLDAEGNIDMLRLTNSHANSPILHMTADYFRKAMLDTVTIY